MRYKLLGTSGLRVSELCLGTMSFGDAWGFGADEKEAHRILSAFALEPRIELPSAAPIRWR